MAEKRRRVVVLFFIVISVLAGYGYEAYKDHKENSKTPAQVLGLNGQLGPTTMTSENPQYAKDSLEKLPVKGRAPKTGYKRAQFGEGWADAGKCDVRNFILNRDLTNPVDKSSDDCTVMTGYLNDPYTGKVIQFQRGQDTSDDIQVDHVVALSDAWQKGAQQITAEQRVKFANDALNLLAVDGEANQQKSDSDAASWLPPNKAYRCRYVAHQIAVKLKYYLWVTQAEKDAMSRVLATCPDQQLPLVNS